MKNINKRLSLFCQAALCLEAFSESSLGQLHVRGIFSDKIISVFIHCSLSGWHQLQRSYVQELSSRWLK